MLLLQNWSVFIYRQLQIWKLILCPSSFSCCETQEPDLWANSAPVDHCPLASGFIPHAACVLLSCCGVQRSINKLSFEINTLAGGLLFCRFSMGSHGVRHDCSDLAVAGTADWCLVLPVIIKHWACTNVDGNEVEASPRPVPLTSLPGTPEGGMRAAAWTRGTDAWGGTPYHSVQANVDDISSA